MWYGYPHMWHTWHHWASKPLDTEDVGLAKACAWCIVAFLMGESVIRSLCQPEIGTQKGVSITVLMATVIFKLRRWCQHYHLTSSKVRHDITDACDITKACWHHEWCQKADQLHRDVNVAHSWQGKSLNKCQIRISPDILNHTCTFLLTWSSVSHRTAGDRQEYGTVIDTKIMTQLYYL